MYSPNKDDDASREKDEKSRSSRSSTEKRRRDSSRERSRRHSSSERRKSESRREHSRSQDRSHRREKHSSHRSRKHRHHSQSPPRRSRSPRDKSRRRSPSYNKAMHAQERLARRLERAKDMIKRKEGGKKDGKFDDGIKRASDVVSHLSNTEAISSRATAQIEALRAKAFAETGVEVPSYYNPLAVNPMVYAQQQAKRKKLWAKKDGAEVEKQKVDQNAASKSALWSGVKFGDNKSDEKFAKLMGIKSLQGQTSKESQDIVKKQAEVFQKLDLQYQQARLATHTQRGVGLGFSSTVIDPNLPTQSNNPAQSSLR